MRKRLLIAAAALSILPATLLATHAHDKNAHGHGALLRHAAEKLELTDEQKERVHGVFAAHRGEIAAELARFRTAHEALFQAVRTPLGEAEVRAAARGLGEAGEELAVLHARLMGEIRRVLTPEQFEKAQALFSQLHGKGGRVLEHLSEHLAGAP